MSSADCPVSRARMSYKPGGVKRCFSDDSGTVGGTLLLLARRRGEEAVMDADEGFSTKNEANEHTDLSA